MRDRKPPRRTFAEIVAEVPASGPASKQYSYSIPRPWVTVDGQRWHLHGNTAHEGSGLHKLLRRDELLAFHDYMNERAPIAPEEREAFWRRAVGLMEESEYSDFMGYLYANADGDRCLVIYECC